MSQIKHIDSTVFLANNDIIRAALKSKLTSVTTMPTLSEGIVGTAYLYTGTTTADFTTNTIYKAISDGGDPATLSWQSIELGSTTISYVSALPTGSSIEDIFYRTETATPYTATVGTDFLDDNTNFTRISDTYTAQSGVTIKASLDNGITYKDFTSLEFDGTDWTLTADGETATLSDGDTFYYEIINYFLYAGNSEKQITERIALYEDLPDGVIVDSELDITSSNAISNSATTTALNSKVTQYSTMPTITATEHLGEVAQYVGTTGQAYTKGYFYQCKYDSENEVYYWDLVKYAADVDAVPTENSSNAVSSGGTFAAIAVKQDSTLSAPLVIGSNSYSTVETAIAGLKAYAATMQTKTLVTSVTMDGTEYTDVETLLGALCLRSVDVDGATIIKDSTTGVLSAVKATANSVGVVKPDGTTLTVDADGTMHGVNTLTFDDDDFDVDNNNVALSAAQRMFTGTTVEWDTLTAEEQAKYSVRCHPDIETGDVVDAVEDGNMKAVTSNAVYDADEELYSKVVDNFIPTSPSAQVVIKNNAGDLSTAKSYTVNTTGLLKVHFTKLYSGNTITLVVNGRTVDTVPNYTGDAESTNPFTTGVLIAFVRAGDSITINCDGNGVNWYVQNVTIQPISWFVS